MTAYSDQEKPKETDMNKNKTSMLYVTQQSLVDKVQGELYANDIHL